MKRPTKAHTRAFGKVCVVMAVSAAGGAYGGGWVFALIRGGMPSTNELGIRGALAISAMSFVGFGWSVLRIVRSQPPLDMRVPSNLNPTLVAALTAALGYIVGTTVFR